jgi:hypothetical protein
VWCTISRNRIIGPIVFDDTINLERHCEVILYSIDHLNEGELPVATSNRAVLLPTQFMFPWRYCMMSQGTE